MKIFYHVRNFTVGEDRKIGREAEFGIEDGMMVENFGFGAIVSVGTTVAAGMGELQPD